MPARPVLSAFVAGPLLLAIACSSTNDSADDGDDGATGGASGASTGGAANGGAAGNVGGTGGVTTGGATTGGGSSTGGAPSGGAGGTAAGASGASSGGESTGGTSGGAGASTGGDAGAGSGSGGMSGASTGGSSGGGKGGTGSGGTAGSAGASCSPPAPTATGLAFPEAEGFGQRATGGRDGAVYHVTNLNDAGAGSFRDAVSQPNRIVVFDVGGYIPLVTAVSVKSNITIAGQTAPGGGIGFRGGEISFANSSNIIFRHVRVRPGSDTADDTDDALSLYRAKNVIIDHSSFEFAPWNNIGAVSDDWQTYPVTDVTFQDNIIANPTGQQFGAHTESVSSNMAWYRNLFANSHNRNPLAKINTVFVNNVLYNCSAGYTTHTSTNFKHDILNNYFIFGPASTGTDNTWYQVDKNQSIYYAGNLKDTTLNGRLDGAATTPYWYQGEGTILTAPWSTATRAQAVSDTPSAYRITVSRAGTLPRDPIDALVISQVRTLGMGTSGLGANTTGPGGGLYTSQAQTGLPNDGYGTIAGGTKPTDTDNDGMPDFWERTAGSNPATNDAMQKTADGYARIEGYLNWLAKPHAQTTGGAAVDIDLATIVPGFSDATPVYTVTPRVCGSVALQPDGHTARFTPSSGFVGVSSFDFTVTGSGATYTARVSVAVQP